MASHISKGPSQKKILLQMIILIANLYVIFLIVWSGLNLIFHDKWFWLFLLNSFGIYLFIPFPILVIFSFLFRKKSLYVVTSISALLFIYFFAIYFVPKPGWFMETKQPTLTVPYLVVGDLNANSFSGAYHSIVQTMTDAWSDSGWGLGHTFPGGNTPGGSRFKIAGYHIPQWLVRIDYIFLSSNWVTQRTWIGNWDRGSDHRPVITTIFLK